MKGIKVDIKNSTKDKICINISTSVKALLDLDYEIKTTENKSLLVINPITNTNYDFPFVVPKEFNDSIHIKTQFITLMNQIKDTYGRLSRLGIKPNVLNSILPLNYKAKAILYTNKENLEGLNGELVEAIKEELNNLDM